MQDTRKQGGQKVGAKGGQGRGQLPLQSGVADRTTRSNPLRFALCLNCHPFIQTQSRKADSRSNCMTLLSTAHSLPLENPSKLKLPHL